MVSNSRGTRPLSVSTGVDAEKMKYVPSGDFNVLSVIELEAVADAAENDAFAALFRVAGYTGLRFGELRALRWRHIDFLNASLHVRRNLPAHATVEKVPKGKRVRSVPLFDQAARAFDLLSHRGYLSPRLTIWCSLATLVAISTTRRSRTPSTLPSTPAGFGHLREKPEPFTLHDLSHSYGTLAVQIYPVTDVQICMGHERIETTMRYVHHVPRSRRRGEGLGVHRRADQRLCRAKWAGFCPGCVRTRNRRRALSG